jgi:hypothetical protein
MANVYQQAAKQRKVIYLATIGALLILSLVVRGTFFRTDKMSVEELKASPRLSLTMDGRAKVHELTELQQGDNELGGATVRLLLTGSRGLAVSALWLNAQQKQKQQEWSELDISVNSIAKLQPHTIGPWLFQSWNLAYNVSVEMDRLNDMYFYIARGISIGADGEALNWNNPDLRWTIAFFYQNKFGVSDRVTTLRCLYQLSCIPDEERDPDRLMTVNSDGSRTINLAAFEDFCRAHPQLIRRMKETRILGDGSEERAQTLARSPEAVVAFLRNNRKLPSRYKPGTRELNDRLKQFPVLPDLTGQPVTTQEVNFKEPLPDHDQDAFVAARAWYSLANCSLPPPSGSPATMGTDNPDPLKYRIPKRPATIIFRQGPMRAQTYYAERLTREGWFDADPWAIDDLIDEDRAWIPKTDADGKRVLVLLKSPASAQEAWKETARRWLEHGTANGLRMDAARLERYRAQAEEYCQQHPGKRVGEQPDPLTPQEAEDEGLRALHYAQAVMNGWVASRFMTNFETFELESDGMRMDDAMLAKKRFYQADRAVRDAAEYAKAVKLYDEGFAAWKRVLVEKQDCRRSRAADPARANQPCRDFRDLERLQDEVYELSMRYVKLSQDVRTVDLRAATVAVHDLLRYAGAGSAGNMLHGLGNLGLWYPLVPQFKAISPFALPGPMDGLAPDGTPWIAEDVKFKVREKLGLVRRTVPQAPPGGPGGGIPLPPTGPPGPPGQ